MSDAEVPDPNDSDMTTEPPPDLEQHLRAAREAVGQAEAALLFLPAGQERLAAEQALLDARLRLDLAERSMVDDHVRLLPSMRRGGEARGFPEPPRPLRAALLETYWEETAAFARSFATASPPALAERLRAHLNRVAAPVDLSATPELRTLRAAVVSETACLAGWAAALAGGRGEAAAAFTFAREVAGEGGDTTLQALASGSLACLYTARCRGRPGGSSEAVRRLREAAALLPATAPPGARAWLAARLAEELAALGNGEGFTRVLAEARAHLADPTPAADHTAGVFGPEGLLVGWTRDGLALELVEAYGRGLLGQAGSAGRLEQLLGEVGDPLRRTAILGDLAAVQLRLGHPARAAMMTTDLFDLAMHAQLFGHLHRVWALRTQLPDDDPATVVLDQRLTQAR